MVRGALLRNRPSERPVQRIQHSPKAYPRERICNATPAARFPNGLVGDWRAHGVWILYGECIPAIAVLLFLAPRASCRSAAPGRLRAAIVHPSRPPAEAASSSRCARPSISRGGSTPAPTSILQVMIATTPAVGLVALVPFACVRRSAQSGAADFTCPHERYQAEWRDCCWRAATDSPIPRSHHMMARR